MFYETRKKFIKSFSEIKIKNVKRLSYRNVANDVLFQRHFTDVDYLDWFSKHKGFCERQYL